MLLTDGNQEVMLANLKFNTEGSFQSTLGLAAPTDAGLVACFEQVRQEFVAARQLRPKRILLVGPPGAGKTHYGEQLSEMYYLPRVNLAELVAETVATGDDELTDLIKDALAELETAKTGKGAKKKAPSKKPAKGAKGAKGPPEEEPKLPLELMVRLLKRKLTSAECRNKGYILDGFPETLEEAAALFKKEVKEGEEAEAPPVAAEDGEEAIVPPPEFNLDTIVHSIVSFDCTLEVAEERMKALDEVQVTAGHNDEDGFARRWATYEYVNDPQMEVSISPLSFFGKALEILEVPMETAVDNAATLSALQIYINTGGKAFNYHPTEGEQASAKAAAEATATANSLQEASVLAQKAADRAAEAQDKLLVNAARKSQVLLDDEELVEACSLPLRKYLLEHVVPPLVDGLLDVCKVQPDDPIDYLAEYLFKHAVGGV
jgi:adenylate kinase